MSDDLECNITQIYADMICPIGDDEAEREAHLGVARRAGEECTGNGELASFVLAESVRLSQSESLDESTTDDA